MKYKKGDDIYLKGQITDVFNYSGASFPYGVNTADELIEVREKDIVSVNEPKKVVVPQYVADWYEENKDVFEYNLYQLCIDFYEKKLNDYLHIWFTDDGNKPIETLVNMHQFGYEVEKEKLYTAKVKIAGEYSGYLNKNVEQGDYFMSSQSESFRVKTHFPQSELEDLGLWNNPAFEIEEVEE